MTIDEEFEKEIAEIMVSFKCSKDFQCYRSGFENLCKATDFGSEQFLECLHEHPEECGFSSEFKDFSLCQCPLRVYIAKKLKK